MYKILYGIWYILFKLGNFFMDSKMLTQDKNEFINTVLENIFALVCHVIILYQDYFCVQLHSLI